MKKKLFGLIMIFIMSISINVYAKTAEDIFNEIVKDGEFSINSVKPTLEGEDALIDLDDHMTLFTIMKYPNVDYLLIYLKDCNDELSICNLSISYSDDGTESNAEYLEREVKVKWVEKNDEVVDEINRIKKVIKDNAHDHENGTNNYYINDLDALKYMVDEAPILLPFLKYSPELKNLINNSHIKLYSNHQWGSEGLFYTYAGPRAFITYDDVIYGFIDCGFGIKNVIYVPDYTGDTNEQLINALMKRIRDFDVSSIREFDLRSNYKTDGDSDYPYDIIGNVNNMSEYYYNGLGANGEFSFVIEKNASVNDPNYKSSSELLSEIAPNDVFSINAFKPVCEKFDEEGNLLCPELDFYPMRYIQDKYPNSVYYVSLNNCNKDLTKCTLTIDIPDFETGDNDNIEKTVKVVWEEDIPKVQKKLDQYAKKIEKSHNKDDMGFAIYDITDLSLINYMYNTKNYNNGNGFNLVANYSKDLRKEFENSNLSYYMDIRLGDDYEMYNYVGGVLVLKYNDIMGKLVSVGIQYKNVIYIPNDTKNTPEDYIAAAKKRIDEYLGNTNAKIEKVGKRSELVPQTHDDPFDFSLLGNEEKMGDYYYKITINNNSDYFVIIRDSSKMEKLKTESTDMVTNVTVSTTDASVPLDTTIKVDEVMEESKEYQKISKILKHNNFRAFNISLHSGEVGTIVRLTNGKFKVIVPFGKDFIGKKIKAYYINDDGTREEFEVTMDSEGNAEFETNHFSTYVLAEEDEVEEVLPDKEEITKEETTKEEIPLKDNNAISNSEEVPRTFDSIMSYVVMLIISIFGIGIAILLKKRFN